MTNLQEHVLNFLRKKTMPDLAEFMTTEETAQALDYTVEVKSKLFAGRRFRRDGSYSNANPTDHYASVGGRGDDTKTDCITAGPRFGNCQAIRKRLGGVTLHQVVAIAALQGWVRYPALQRAGSNPLVTTVTAK